MMRPFLRSLGRSIIWGVSFILMVIAGAYVIKLTWGDDVDFSGPGAMLALVGVGMLGAIAQDLSEAILPSIDDMEF